MTMEQLITDNFWWLVIVFIWSLGWKGWALWIAAHKDQKPWFVVLLILNTAGILEIFYIFYFSKQVSAKSIAKK